MRLSGKHMLWALILGLLAGCTQNRDEANNNQTTAKKEWAIVLHGGAGVIPKSLPDSVREGYMTDLDEALSIGEAALEDGASALDAVERVIRYLEDNPRFNAGKGAVFTHDGAHELDAAIMIGNTREAGAITGVKTIKNPISLARLVMENSKHVMFAGDGAEEYAGEMGVERVNQDYFYTEKRHRAWKEAVKDDTDGRSSLINPAQWEDKKYGTVGCVALDKEGVLVAGTSTGGMTNKMYGRVGDVPIIGSGTYASDIVAVSMTGWGEKIMKAVSGHTVSSYMQFKDATLEQAGDYLLDEVLDPDDAGMIAVDKYGNTYMDMNTSGMFRGKSDSEGNREVAIWDE